MEGNTNSLVFDDALESQKSLLFEKLIGMAKEGYTIGGILTEKKSFEKKAGLENIELSQYSIEQIVSSILFYTTYTLGSIDDTLEEVNNIKKELIDYKITDSNKKTITYGIKEYRHDSKVRDSANKLAADIQKLKLHGLYLEDSQQQVIQTKSDELVETMSR